jgi:type IV secretory pathway VirB4 component
MDLIHRNQGTEFLLEDLQNLLRKKRGGDKLAQALSTWTTGRYKRLFNARNSRSLGNPFTVFDLSKVVENKDVLPLMFASIVTFVMEMGRSYQHAPKYLIFDEAWRVLQDPMMAAFIESCYRALRKLEFCVITMSQSIEEFVNSGSRTAITANLVHKLVLKQNSAEAATALATEFGFTEAELGIIRRLETKRGEYSQALLHHSLADGRTRSHLVVCRPTPLSYAIASTNPNDRREFARIFAEHRDFPRAVDEFARLYPNGVSDDLAHVREIEERRKSAESSKHAA